MSQITPTTETAVQLESQVNGANNSGNTDIMHFISNGEVVSWIDYDGFPGGNLNTGGGGGVLSVNGTPVPNPNLVAGANVTYTVTGSNVVTAATGGGGGGGSTVSVNGVTVTNPNFEDSAGSAFSVSGANITLDPTEVLSVSGIPVSNPNLLPSTGIGLVVSGSNITVENLGPLTSVTPWLDVQNYGGIPKPASFASEAIACTTNGTTTVTLASPGHFVNGEGVVGYAMGPQSSVTTAPTAPTLTCPAISGSGPANAQQTISYQIAGFDVYGGLTPASSSGQLTTAPAIFGSKYVTVSSISQASDVVTVNFSGPLNQTVVAGMTLHLKGFTSTSNIFNGVWTIASVLGLNQVTFALAGSFGSGTTSGLTVGRVSNVALISTISRSSLGVVTITTVQPHDFTTQTGNNPTVINIENTQSSSGNIEDLNGQFLIATASGSTITINTGNFSASTGTVLQNSATRGASTATVWEFITVNCPAVSTNTTHTLTSINQAAGVVTVNFTAPLSATVTAGQTLTLSGFAGTSSIFNGIWVIATAPTTSQVTFLLAGNLGAGVASGALGILAGTIGYYIYSDSINPGGSLVLIGKTLAGEHHYADWGPFYASGYVAPAYVPTAPPAVSQNQLFRSSIVSGGSSTTLELASAPTVSLGSLSGTIVHDDSNSLNSAAQAGVAAGSQASINFSPPANVISLNKPFYVINYPVTVPGGFNVLIGCGLIVNETVTYTGTNQIYSPFGSTTTNSPQFSSASRPTIQGLGNPMFLMGEAVSLTNLGFEVLNGNGLNQVMFGTGSAALYPSVTECSFDVNNLGTSVPLIFNGQISGISLENLTFFGVSVLGDVDVIGQSSQGPPVPLLWFRASDNPLQQGIGPASVSMSGGYNAFCSRGILVDGQYRTTGSTTNYQFPDAGFIWNQAMTQPSVMFWGQSYSQISVGPMLNDSSFLAVLANWAFQGILDVDLDQVAHAGSAPLITGGFIANLDVSQSSINPVGQSYGLTKSETATINPGNGPSIHPTTTGLSIQSQPFKLASNSGVVFASVPRLVITAVDAGSGSLGAGTYIVECTQVGWDGGETGPSNSVSVTIAASHAITVTWGTINGFKGVNVYFSGAKQNSSPLTGTSTTISSFNNQGIPPTDDGTGLPAILYANSTGLAVVQDLIIPSGTNSSAITAGTLTGNRTVSVPDNSGTMLVGSAVGIGTGSPAGMTVNNQGAGQGPVNAIQIVGWTEINLGGQLFWIPLAQ